MAIKIALAGNPNCGKTTMFNALTGANQYVGNWPGVTVEKKEGRYKKANGQEVIVTDLPGIYSLSPYTLEEVVSRNYLLEDDVDVIIDLVDATNIERNLYLTTQLVETGIPVVVALNMADLMKKRKIRVDSKALSEKLNVKVVETSALKGTGLKELMDVAIDMANTHPLVKPQSIFEPKVEKAILDVMDHLDVDETKKRWYAIKYLENDTEVIKHHPLDGSTMQIIGKHQESLTQSYDMDMESVFTDQRYGYITDVVSTCVKKGSGELTISDKIDKIVTNRILGIPIFLIVMFVVYYLAIGTVGTMMTDWTNDVLVVSIQEAVGGWLTAMGTSDILISAVVDGIIGGLGAVLGFLPQMAVLFLLLSILEDCGYMVRIAFVMDRVFRHFGLSGKSFIPLMISSGCGIPGIMASRTIEQDNDRRLTIMTATFVPCSAKLPVIALMGGVMTGYISGSWNLAGILTPIMYFVGIIAVMVAAIILKKTKPFSGKPAPFVMELPQYHIPGVKTVLMHVWERLKGFIIKAGTILFLACVVMWFLGGFGFVDGTFGMVESPNDSLLALIGGFIAPLFAPLGFGTWQPVAASLSGFTAKEAIVSTMGVLANVAEDLSEDPVTVAQAVAGWFPSMAAGFSFLLFNLLDSPCLAAIATMAQQLQDRKWFWFAIIFQNVFAYVICLIVYQIWNLLSGGAFGLWSGVAIVLLIGLIYLLFRKNPYGSTTESKRSVAAANV